MIDDECTATGCCAMYVPPGNDRDQLLKLIRIGESFLNNQVGRRPGFLHQYIAKVVDEMGGAVTLASVIDRLEESIGATDSPIEKVNRDYGGHIVYYDPKHGRKEILFDSLYAHFSCKK